MKKSRTALSNRLLNAALVFGVLLLSGTLAYYLVGHGRWTTFECFYMTLTTIATVGYGEILPGMELVPGARAVSVTLILVGSGTVLYFASSLTAMIIEGDLKGILRRRKMDRLIEQLSGHTVLCGIGSTGKHVATELKATNRPFVVVDRNEGAILELGEELGLEVLYVIGEASDDHVLHRAGIARAGSVVCALTDDKDNLFVTISARALNATARIVAKCIEPSTEMKLRRAGASSVVSPNYIGGLRMASEVLRPKAVAFIDRMLREQGDAQLRIEELHIPAKSYLVGRRLMDTPLRQEGALVVALHRPDGEYLYLPPGELVLEAESSLVVLARLPDVERIRGWLAGAARA